MTSDSENLQAALSIVPGGYVEASKERIKRIRALDGNCARSTEFELLEMLEHPISEVRRQAIDALWDRGGVLARIGCRSSVNDADWMVRDISIEALGEIGTDLDVPLVIRATADGEWVVRATAASSLAGMSPRCDVCQCVPLMIRLLDSDPSTHVRRYVAVALGDMIGTQATPILEMRVSQETDASALSGIYATLYRLGDQSKLVTLLKLLDTYNSEVMHQVFASLYDVKTEDAETVVEYINDLLDVCDDEEIRSEGSALIDHLSGLIP